MLGFTLTRAFQVVVAREVAAGYDWFLELAKRAAPLSSRREGVPPRASNWNSRLASLPLTFLGLLLLLLPSFPLSHVAIFEARL